MERPFKMVVLAGVLVQGLFGCTKSGEYSSGREASPVRTDVVAGTARGPAAPEGSRPADRMLVRGPGVHVPRSAEKEGAAEDPADACRRAGGVATSIEECNGSQSLWCRISEREECYADQVRGGRCTVGEYSEELKGIVGISPRVLCDGAGRQ